MLKTFKVHYSCLTLTTLFVGNMAKGRISKRRQQEYKARQIFRKTNVRFSENLTCFVCILVTSVLRFALLPYYRRIEINLCKNLFSLERFCSFCKPCYGLTKIELLAKFVMGLLRWSFLRK